MGRRTVGEANRRVIGACDSKRRDRQGTPPWIIDTERAVKTDDRDVKSGDGPAMPVANRKSGRSWLPFLRPARRNGSPVLQSALCNGVSANERLLSRPVGLKYEMFSAPPDTRPGALFSSGNDVLMMQGADPSVDLYASLCCRAWMIPTTQTAPRTVSI